MAMEQDPEKINDADRYIKSKLLEQGQGYAERNEISKVQNKKRAESREAVKKLGFTSKGYQWGLSLAKDFTAAEAAQIMRDMKVVYEVMSDVAPDLFKDEVMKAKKREADQKAREAEAKTQAGRDPDHPRSDPKSGGAGKKKGKKAAAAEAIVQQNSPGEHEDEQAEGEAVFSELAPETEAAKQSQSARARAILKETGLDEPN